MKKSVALLLSCSALLLADLNDAQRLYNQKNYTAASAEAKRSTADYANPQLHLIWARSAKALGKNLEAMSAYERVVMIDPNNIEAKKELVKVYLALKKPRLAIEVGEELRAKNIHFDEIQVIRKASASSWKQAKFKSKFSLALGYDNNVNVNNDDTQDLDSFWGTTAHSNKVSSLFYRATANIEYLQEFANHFYLKTSFGGYYKVVSQDSDYSVYLNTIKAGIGYYSRGKYNFYMPLSYSALNYLGEDLLRMQSINPQIDYVISEKLIASINTKYEKREFKTNRDRDDKSYALGATLYYKLNKNDYLYFDSEYQDYSSDSDNYQDYSDKTTVTLVAGLGYKFSDDLKADASYKVRFSDYEDDIGTILDPSSETRSDTYHQINVKLTKKIRDNMSLYIENEYALNDSNYIPADYSKNSLLVGINLTY
ncbi:MAG: surface lipoprotein assembly modifier [Campylobacterota bacterium]|nr:surface lipoprotein assembly modifier [Campylobacterota bacterium]